MGEVVRLKRERRETLRGVSRKLLTEVLDSTDKPDAVVIVALKADGRFAIRSANHETMQDFDMYSRAGALIEAQRMKLLDSD
jgi:hypothetical protein